MAFSPDDDLMMPDHLALMRDQFVDPSVALVCGQVGGPAKGRQVPLPTIYGARKTCAMPRCRIFAR